MKNKFIIFLFILFFGLIQNHSLGEENFIFESKTLEILNSGNTIKASNGVRVLSQNGIEITSKNSEYDKLENILHLSQNIFIKENNKKINLKSDKATYFKSIEKIILNKNVVVNDLDKNITLRSNEIEYSKNNQQIISKERTEIDIDSKFKISGENIYYNLSNKTISSENKAVIKDNYKNDVIIEDFIYSISKKTLKAKKINFTDIDGNKFNTLASIMELDREVIASKDIEILFSEGELGKNAKLKGKSLIKNENKTIVKKGIFTTCETKSGCAPWSIKSKKITHDKSKKTIYYDDSIFQLYDIPVFYFPKFFHPDPSVRRQSGFLAPSLINSSSLGNSIKIPYYKVISENKDLTFSPRFFANNDLLLQNEYRQIQKNTKHISDFSIKKMDGSSKSHFFTNTKFNLDNGFNFSELEVNIEKTSNDTYLKKNKIISDTKSNSNQSLLNSYLNYNGANEDFKISAEVQVYEDLTKKNSSDKFQYIYPNFTISKLIKTNLDIRGDLNYQLSGSNQQKETNISETYLINDLNYSSKSFFSKFGTISNIDLFLKNTLKKGENSSNYDKNTKNELYSALIFNSSYPLKKIHEKEFISNLTPKFLVRYSPTTNEDLSGLDRKIFSTNIYSNNRLGLTDSLEGGQSITMGIDYNLNDQNNIEKLNAGLSQIFRDSVDEKLPLKSKMQNKASDIVGHFNFYPSNNFNINYNFSIDNNIDAMNYNKLNTNLTINNFITSFEFLEENNEIGSDSYLSSDLKYLFNNNNSLSYNTRRNRKTNLTEYYNLIYEYKNDCLIAAIEYNKDYYQDRDLEPNEEIFFKLTITPLTSVNSPNFK